MTENKEHTLEGYRKLIEIARDLASTLDLDILLSRIVFAAAEITEAGAASILLYDEASRQLHFQSATNLDDITRRGIVVPIEGSIAGWILTHREAVRVGDAHGDPRFFPKVESKTGFSTKSIIGVPMITKDKVVGVLEVLNKRKGDFSAMDESMLMVLGAQAAVAIENARLFQQSDLISEFVHELRTPLSSLSTATYLLLRPEISKEQHDQIVHNIHNETIRLNALASSFLDLARLESGRVQFRKSSFSVIELLEECREVLASRAQESGIQVRVTPDAGLPTLEADRDKVKQVILNLLSNAVKYNRPNGTVTLQASAGEKEFAIQVQDTGMGIPDEALPHLFQKFFRVRDHESRAEGTGLGLSICKQIVTGHGGRIEVQSKAGTGTTFTVFMPRSTKVLIEEGAGARAQEK